MPFLVTRLSSNAIAAQLGLLQNLFRFTHSFCIDNIIFQEFIVCKMVALQSGHCEFYHGSQLLFLCQVLRTLI